MKKLIASLFVVSALMLSFPATSASKEEVVKVVPTLSQRQLVWLHALEWCESKGRPEALNPKDKDGTPSYGLLQFKPGTFNTYAKLYGIDPKAGYKDAETQEKIVSQMILRKNIKWSHEFPQCTRLLGNPPA